METWLISRNVRAFQWGRWQRELNDFLALLSVLLDITKDTKKSCQIFNCCCCFAGCRIDFTRQIPTHDMEDDTRSRALLWNCQKDEFQVTWCFLFVFFFFWKSSLLSCTDWKLYEVITSTSAQLNWLHPGLLLHLNAIPTESNSARPMIKSPSCQKPVSIVRVVDRRTCSVFVRISLLFYADPIAYESLLLRKEHRQNFVKLAAGCSTLLKPSVKRILLYDNKLITETATK